MLARMYQRWAERPGMKVELIDHHSASRPGQVGDDHDQGENAYGYAKTEAGPRWSASVPMIRRRARHPASLPSWSIRWSTRISTVRTMKATCASTLPRVRAGGQHINTRSVRQDHHLPTNIASNAKTSARSNKNKAAMNRSVPASIGASCRSATPRPAPAPRRRPTSAGPPYPQLRPSALPNWSRTCAPGTSTAPLDVLTGISTVHGRGLVAARDRRAG